MRSSHLLMLLVFAVTLFLSALLLFLVQPMVGKMILPMLGGSPAVWNTCMVFFQAMLLAGYAYAHASTRWLGPRKQAAMHLALLVIPLIVLPISVSKELAPEGEANPVLGVLVLLFVAVGFPFFVVSASAPLLQRWFASTDNPAARDPYFLYGASNLGSMLALVFYPWLVEPSLKLAQQSWVWAGGYALLALLTAGSALLLWRSQPAPARAPEPAKNPSSTSISRSKRKGRRKEEPAPIDVVVPNPAQMPVTAWRRLRWIALAFVPSSLMLGMTTYITTDIAAIPLLWVIPLALYLISFILVFSRLPAFIHKGMILLLPLMVLLLACMMLSGFKPDLKGILPEGFRHPVVVDIMLHAVVLFVVAMVCHGELARDRPAPANLTEFFLWLSVGGVLGGMFNALIAPVLFNGIVEYQLALVLACLVMPSLSDKPGEGLGFKFDLALAACLAITAFAAFYAGMVHVKEQITKNENQVAKLAEEGLSVPDWLDEYTLRLRGDVTKLQLGQAIVVGFVLIAPLGWFLSRNPTVRSRWFDFVLPAALGLLVVGLLLGFYNREWEFTWARERIKSLSGGRFDFTPALMVKALIYAFPALLCYIFVERPLRFALAFGAFVLACNIFELRHNTRMHQERSYFGVLTIYDYNEGNYHYHRLHHGTTIHGMQCMDDGRRQDPLTYYHHNGPVGQLYGTYPDAFRNYAVVGLGTGTMAAYGDDKHKITFYEIDRHVRDIARNKDYFTYLSDYKERTGGEEAKIVMGDARLQMEKARLDDKYTLIIVDAFSSDAIPVHLITLEGLNIFFDKLADNGIVAYHISNRWLELDRVLHNLARETRRAALIKHDSGDGDECYASTWVVLARDEQYLERLKREDWYPSIGREVLKALSGFPNPSLAATAAMLYGVCERPIWQPLEPKGEEEKAIWERVGVWTDDYSNILSVFDWKR